jgi:hypothetical protein
MEYVEIGVQHFEGQNGMIYEIWRHKMKTFMGA